MHFQVTMAGNVRCYYRQTVEADSVEEALAKAKAADEWICHERGDDADAFEPSYYVEESDEDGVPIEDGEGYGGDDRDDPDYIYKTDLMAFVKMLADAVAESNGLVNDNTGALMTPESIRRTARHILKVAD